MFNQTGHSSRECLGPIWILNFSRISSLLLRALNVLVDIGAIILMAIRLIA